MNEEAIKLSYSQAVKGGYNGNTSDYIELLSSNKEAANLAYKEALDGGYNGEMSDFEELMGIKKKDQSTQEPSSSLEGKSLSPTGEEVDGIPTVSVEDDAEFELTKESPIVKPREGVRKNPDGTESTHLMAREYVDGKGWVAFPTLFQNEDGTWVDMSSMKNGWGEVYKEAQKRGEVYEFGENEEAAINFADKGSWKKDVKQETPPTSETLSSLPDLEDVDPKENVRQEFISSFSGTLQPKEQEFKGTGAVLTYRDPQVVEQEKIAEAKNYKIKLNEAKGVTDSLTADKNYYDQTPQELEQLREQLQTSMKAAGKPLDRDELDMMVDMFKQNSLNKLANQEFSNQVNDIVADPMQGNKFLMGLPQEPAEFTPEQQREQVKSSNVNYVRDEVMSPNDAQLYDILQQLETETNPRRVEQLKKRADALRKTPMLYDPETGNFTDKVTPQTEQYQQEVDELAEQYQQTPKEKLDELFNKYTLALRNLKKQQQNIITNEKPQYTFTILGANQTPAVEAFREKLSQKRQQINETRKQVDALSKAYLLNIDPAYVETGFFERGLMNLKKGFAESNITGTVISPILESLSPNMTPTEYQKVYEEVASKEGLDLTDKQQEEFDNTLGEQTTDGLFSSAPIMADIGFVAGVTRGAGNATGISRTLARVGDIIGNKYGKFTKAAYNSGRSILQSSAEFYAGGAGAVTGASEEFGEQLVGAIPILKKYNGIFKGLLKSGGGTLGAFVGEYTGELGNALVEDGLDLDKAFEDTFGRTPKEQWEKAVVTFLTSAVYGSPAMFIETGKALKQYLKGLPPSAEIDAAMEEIDNVLTKTETDAIQEPSPEEVDVRQQTEDGETVEQKDQEQVITEEGQKEVIEENKLTTTNSLLPKIEMGESVADEDIESAQDELIQALDDVENSDKTEEQKRSANNVIEHLYNKLEGYEFRTKKVADATTTKEAVPTPAKAKSRLSKKDWGGKQVEVNGEKGTIEIDEDNFTFQSEDGTTTDLDASLISGGEGSVELNENGDVESFTITTQDGQNVKVTDQDLALDLAIRDRMDKVGEVPNQVFEERINEIYTPEQRQEYVKSKKDEKQEKDTTQEQPMLEGVQTSRNQEEGRQESAELRTEETQEVKPISFADKARNKVEEITKEFREKQKSISESTGKLGIDPFASAEERAKQHRELFDIAVRLAKAYVDLGVANVKDFINDVKADVPEDIARAAFETATGKRKSPKANELKKLIEKTTGVTKKKGSEQKRINKAYAIGEAFGNLAGEIAGIKKGIKEQKARRKAVVEKINEFISKNLDLKTKITPAKAKTLARRALKIEPDNQKSIDSFIDYAEKLIEKSEQEVHGSLVDKAKKETSPSKLKQRRPSGLAKGKTNVPQGRILKAIHNALKSMDIDGVRARINEINESTTIDEKMIDEMEGLLIAEHFLRGDLESAERGMELLEAVKKDGKTLLRSKLEKKAKEYNEMKESAIDAVTGGKGIKTGFEKINNARGNWIKGFLNSIHGFLDRSEGFRTLMDKISRDKGRDKSGFGSILDKIAYMPIARARAIKNKINREALDEVTENLKRIYGKDYKKKVNANSKKKLVGVFNDADGKEQAVELSQNQAYRIYQYAQDPRNKATFEKMGFTQEMIDAIIDYLDPQVKEWADWQMNEFYPKYYERINKVYKEQNYIDLPKQDLYVPIIRDATAISKKDSETLDPNAATFTKPSVTYSSLKERQNSTVPFDLERDGDQILTNYMYGMNQYIAFADAIKKLDVIFGDSKVREGIRQNNNKEVLSIIDRFVKDLTNDSIDRALVIAALDKLRTNVVTASLALSPTVLIKQLASFPAYATDIPAINFIKGMGKFAINPVKAYNTLMESDYMKERYKSGFDRDLAEAMAKDYKATLKGKSKFMDKLMFLIKYGDAGAIMMGGYSVYDYHYNSLIKQGFTPQKAKKEALFRFEEATKLSQQSTGIEDLGDFQRLGSLGKMFTMYMTSPIAYFRQERKSLRDFYRGNNRKDAVKRFMVYHMVLPMVFQYAASAFPALLTDWDEDDTEDMARAALLGSVNGVFLVGDLIEWVADKFSDKPWAYKDYNASPVFGTLSNFTDELKKFVDEYTEAGDDKFSEDVIEQAIELSVSGMDATGLPASRIKKMYENWDLLLNAGDELSPSEKAALGLGYSKYSVVPKKEKDEKKKSLFKKPKKSQSLFKKKAFE